jgi:hypothetical protein
MTVPTSRQLTRLVAKQTTPITSHAVRVLNCYTHISSGLCRLCASISSTTLIPSDICHWEHRIAKLTSLLTARDRVLTSTAPICFTQVFATESIESPSLHPH